LEKGGGNPHVALAASDYGALLVVFASAEDREATLSHFPLRLDGHTITLERPQDGCNKAAWTSSRFALLSATGFPPELWDEVSIRAAFCTIGSVSCVDPLCLRELDYSALRLVVKLGANGDVPPVLLLHDAYANCTTEVRVRAVRTWANEGDGSSPHCIHFDINPGGAPPPASRDDRRPSRMSDIDEASVRGDSPVRSAPPPCSSVLGLWSHIVARRQADAARAVVLDTVDGMPADSAVPLPLPSPASPVDLWDRILARRLAGQFPETGLSADQVPTSPNSPSFPFAALAITNSPPLLQWFDTL
jgi:hypothetical protein